MVESSPRPEALDPPPHYVAERRNVLVNTAQGGRVLSATMLPWFLALPPNAWGVLTTTGRRTGKRRRKCVRAVRDGDKVYLVSLRPGTAWLRNLRANPDVRLRLRGGTFSGRAREPVDERERQTVAAAYCRVYPFDYVAHLQHRRGRPTRQKVLEMVTQWLVTGVAVVVDLDARA